MNIKITKRKLIDEAHNSTVGNQWWYKVNGRIENDDNTLYKPFYFVLFFDGDDLWEAGLVEEDEIITDKILREYVDELSGSMCDLIKSFDDCKDFIDACNGTIERWNDMKRREWEYQNRWRYTVAI